MEKYFTLSQSAVARLAEDYGTPLLVLSVEQIESNYRYLAQHLPGVNIYYAVKANPNEHIVQKLAELGSCFDVASDGEIMQLNSMGIAASRLVYANPVKTRNVWPPRNVPVSISLPLIVRVKYIKWPTEFPADPFY